MALQHSNSLALSSANGFLVLEGVNGAGKSSLQRTIAAHLYKLGDEVLQTFEPGDTPVGKEIRRLVLSSGRELHPLMELFLFTADRVEHVSEVILPALQAGKRVISDRFTYSTLAFQGYGRDLDLAFISKVNEVATAGCTPDLVIL